MARELRPYEFYHNLAKKIGISDEDCQYNCEVLVEFIVEELQHYGSIQIPNLGKIKANKKGGKYQHMPISNLIKDKGKTKIIYIEPYLQASFHPTERFKEILNGGRLPKAEVKRQKEELRKKEQMELEAQRQIEIAEKQREAINREREKRLERIAKRKAYINKKKGVAVEEKIVDPSDYGSLKEK